MVDKDEGGKCLGVCKVEDAVRQAVKSVIWSSSRWQTIGMYTFHVFQLGAT